jgi:hypothetical protein
VLEGQTIEPHGDGDAADKGGVVLADQDHGASLSTRHLPGLMFSPVMTFEGTSTHY